MKHIVCLFIILFLLYSCKQESKGAINKAIEIDLRSTETMDIKDLLSVSYLKLENDNRCLIGNVNQLVAENNLFYILDGVVSKGLYVFSDKGKFVNKVGKVGNGPGEYISPMSFNIDKRNNRISILDVDQNKILFYNLSDYSFERESKMPFYSSEIEWLGDNKVAMFNTLSEVSHSYLLITDKEFSIRKELLPLVFSSGYKIGTKKRMYKYNNELFVSAPFDPIVYRLGENDSIYPYYRITFAKSSLPPIEYLKQTAEKEGNYIPSLFKSEYVAFYEIHETNDLICIPYFVNNTMFYGFYRKDKEKTYNFTQDQIAKALKISAYSSPVGCTNEGFISLLNPYLLKQNLKDGYKFDESLSKIIEQSKDDDNPILMIYKMNK